MEDLKVNTSLTKLSYSWVPDCEQKAEVPIYHIKADTGLQVPSVSLSSYKYSALLPGWLTLISPAELPHLTQPIWLPAHPLLPILLGFFDAAPGSSHSIN